MAQHQHPACSIEKKADAAYAGEITPIETFSLLTNNSGILVDVRTPEEWRAGVPDISGLVKLSWKIGPDYTVNPNFPQEFDAQNINKDTPLYFMCRGGGRSLAAATAMTAAGYRFCYNITDGFEGMQGWKNSQLPWKQG